MNIAILGSGAMGMLFGALLSQHNSVTLVDVNEQRVEDVNTAGILIQEPDGTVRRFYPAAVTDSSSIGPVDLVIVFVKALYSRSALSGNKALLGPLTRVLTLQNGSGHENILKEFVTPENIIIGMTQHNSSIQGQASIHHGCGGLTYIGCLDGRTESLDSVAEAFSACGLETRVSPNVQRIIWNKMFLNVSGSALTAALQVKMGFLVDDVHGWTLTETLVREAVSVANAEGMGFDPDQVVTEVHRLMTGAHEGYTSIYADLRDGRRSEVDTISGSVVAAGKRNGTPTPCHSFVVELIHAMEDKNEMLKEEN